jgi:hypothetical protein
MPPKKKPKRKTTSSSEEPSPHDDKGNKGENGKHDDKGNKGENGNDSSTLHTLETPFDAHMFLQQRRNQSASQNQLPVFHLNAASVAKAAASAPPVLSLPPVSFVVPELTNSSSFSTLSRVPETPAPHIKQAVSSRVAVTPMTVPSAQFNLSMTAFSDKTIRSIIKTCMKDHIFPKCKFYHRDKHGTYDRSPTSMCGQIMKHCSLEADATWWYQIRPVIVKTHTDHRNNCIKRLKARFKGMSKTHVCICSYRWTYCVKYFTGVSRGRAGQPMWQLMDGSPRDQQKLLQMRANCALYCAVLDHFAPAVVGGTKWNNDTNMHSFCTTSDTKAFAKHVLTVSDEAFIILVLINATPRWMAEVLRAEKKVCCDL